MPALPLIPPEVLKEVLFKYAYELIDHDDYNWVLRRGEELPLVIPKRGDLVAREIMENALNQSKMNNATYFRFLKQVRPDIQCPEVTIEENP